MNAAIIHSDIDFLEGFSNYIRCQNRRDNFSFFHTLEEFENETITHDYIFIDENLVQLAKELNKFNSIILSSNNQSKLDSIPSINIYQKAEGLLREIIEIIDQRKMSFVESDHVRRKCFVYSIFSASGGIGKTTFSLGFSKFLRNKYGKVLIISFETFQSISTQNLRCISDLFISYSLHTKFGDNIALSDFIENIDGIDYLVKKTFEPFDEDFSKIEFGQFVEWLKMEYNAILFDLNSDLSVETICAFHYCDAIIEIFSNKQFENEKHKNFNNWLVATNSKNNFLSKHQMVDISSFNEDYTAIVMSC